MEERYKLIDLTTYSKEGKTYYYAIVYFYGQYHNDIIKVSINQENFEKLQEYLNTDITNHISISYNSFSKKYVPSINVVY